MDPGLFTLFNIGKKALPACACKFSRVITRWRQSFVHTALRSMMPIADS